MHNYLSLVKYFPKESSFYVANGASMFALITFYGLKNMHRIVTRGLSWSKAENLDEEKDHSFEGGQHLNAALFVVPKKQLDFKVVTDGNCAKAQITLSNTSNLAMVFKIKCTSPSMYQTTPKQGILYPFSTQAIQVMLHDINHQAMVCFDKFLIIYTSVDKNITTSEARNMFLAAKNGQYKFSECRLTARIVPSECSGYGDQETAVEKQDRNSTLSDMMRHEWLREENLRQSQRLANALFTLCLILLALILIVYLCNTLYDLSIAALKKPQERVQYVFLPGPFPFF